MYCILIQKNQFEVGKQMFIKYLSTAETSMLEYFLVSYPQIERMRAQLFSISFLKIQRKESHDSLCFFRIENTLTDHQESEKKKKSPQEG